MAHVLSNSHATVQLDAAPTTAASPTIPAPYFSNHPLASFSSDLPPLKRAKRTKRFICSHCERSFARREHLQRHQRTHTRERPFVCQLCAQDFSRSDLLTRHHRLVHKDEPQSLPEANGASHRPQGTEPSQSAAPTESHHEHPVSSAQILPAASSRPSSSHPSPAERYTDSMVQDMPLKTLSAAVDYAATLEGMMSHQHQKPALSDHASAATNPPQPPSTLLSDSSSRRRHRSPSPHGPNAYSNLESHLNSLAFSLEDEPFSSPGMSSLTGADQPLPIYSPDMSLPTKQSRQRNVLDSLSEMDFEPGFSSLSQFSSRLSSIPPEDGGSRALRPSTPRKKPFYDISTADRTLLLQQLNDFKHVVPADFHLPSCLTLSRYIAGYMSGFHDHLPFLHVPTISIATCPVELILAIAAVGSQYCFESQRGVEIFKVSLAIAAARIKRKDAMLAAECGASSTSSYSPHWSAMSTPHTNSIAQSSQASPLLGSMSLSSPSEPDNLIQTAQALLALMAMATWAKHKAIFREALAIQSLLATLVREDGLEEPDEIDQVRPDISWERWAWLESSKRTKLLVYCFFNLNCLVYNIPPLILSSEIHLTLPCSSEEFAASSASDWRSLRSYQPQPRFQDCFMRLFDRHETGGHSQSPKTSLGNYILIHALIQHIFFARQLAKCRPSTNGDLTAEEASATEYALRKWQRGWRGNPESALDPTQDPAGRLAFNSTALLRLAYLRLHVGDLHPLQGLDGLGRSRSYSVSDNDPTNSLNGGFNGGAYRDPSQLARLFLAQPRLRRSPRLVRAILHCAHALAVPIKLGIGVVARSQSLFWSIQHSLCSLECAFLLSKWLAALAEPQPQPPVSQDERRIVALVKSMLDETDFAIRIKGRGIKTRAKMPTKHTSSHVKNNSISSHHHHHRYSSSTDTSASTNPVPGHASRADRHSTQWNGNGYQSWDSRDQRAPHASYSHVPHLHFQTNGHHQTPLRQHNPHPLEPSISSIRSGSSQLSERTFGAALPPTSAIDFERSRFSHSYSRSTSHLPHYPPMQHSNHSYISLPSAYTSHASVNPDLREDHYHVDRSQPQPQPQQHPHQSATIDFITNPSPSATANVASTTLPAMDISATLNASATSVSTSTSNGSNGASTMPIIHDAQNCIQASDSDVEPETETENEADTDASYSPTAIRQLSSGVLNVWATIFQGSGTWALVDLIGSGLSIYADLI